MKVVFVYDDMGQHDLYNHGIEQWINPEYMPVVGDRVVLGKDIYEIVFVRVISKTEIHLGCRLIMRHYKSYSMEKTGERSWAVIRSN